MDTMQAITEAVTQEFADSSEAPVVVTRAVVIAEAFTDNGERCLYLWTPKDMTYWERIGMLEAELAQLKHDFTCCHCE